MVLSDEMTMTICCIEMDLFDRIKMWPRHGTANAGADQNVSLCSYAFKYWFESEERTYTVCQAMTWGDCDYELYSVICGLALKLA